MGRLPDALQEHAKTVAHDKENTTVCQGPLPLAKTYGQPDGLDSAAGWAASFQSSVLSTTAALAQSGGLAIVQALVDAHLLLV